MAKRIGLPKLSPTMEEGTIARWIKKEGDAVEIDDILAEVETDKATMEFRSFDKGVLLKILAPEGATLAPDAPVCILGQKGEDISALVGGEAAAKVPAKTEANAEPKVESVNGQAASAEAAATPPAPKSATAPDPAAAESPKASGGRVFASPLVRKLAREHQIDLHDVTGSGPHGRIVKRDMDAALANPPAKRAAAGATTTQQQGASPFTVVKLSQMRKTIARRLTESKQTIPHFYLTIDIDAGPLSDAREKLNTVMAARAEKGSVPDKLSLNDLVIKGVAQALVEVPECNVTFHEDEIHFHSRVDISMAVAIPDGLVTPVIRGAERKSLRDISREARELAKKARDKKLKLEEMKDGTFSISNLGMFGIDDFSAVINPPEGAILAVSVARDEPVVVGGALAVGKRMKMTMSCDHRVIDGALGARFLKVLREILENPVMLSL